MIKKKLFFHPAVIFAATWLLVAFLYALRFSSRLTEPLLSIAILLLIVIGGYFLGSLLSVLAAPRIRVVARAGLSRLQRRAAIRVLVGLLFLAVLETIIEGFIPAISMIRGVNISHFEFGISSVHGLIIAGLCACGAVFFTEFCRNGDKTALWLAMLPIVYSVLYVSRKMFTVCFLEYLLIFLYVRPIGIKAVLRSLTLVLGFIFAFGAFGDLRGRSSTIDDYGGFGDGFHFVGDTGFRWVYLYVTTPLENLSYTTRNFASESNVGFRRTFGPIVPSAVRNLLGEDTNGATRFLEAGIERYWLQSAVFNVSTGFNEPYLDNGIPGIFIYSVFIGFITSLAFLRFIGPVGMAVFGALLTGSLLTVFSNSFANLNYVGQFLFFLIIKYPVLMKRPEPTHISLARS